MWYVFVCMHVCDVLMVHPLMNFIKEPICPLTFFTRIFITCRGFVEWDHTFLGTILDHTLVTFLNICLIVACGIFAAAHGLLSSCGARVFSSLVVACRL